MAGFEKTSFSELAGWRDHDHKAAFAAFCLSAAHLLECSPTEREQSAKAEDLLFACREALAQPKQINNEAARAFFESHFYPQRLTGQGLMTGYYEPVFAGSLTKSDAYSVPLLQRPEDLVSISSQQALSAGFSEETSFARKTDAGLSFHLSRSEIMAGGLEGQGLELVWLKDPFDAYIVHIQGSARIQLQDGSSMRVTFDGKSGHPYRSLGKLLIEQGVFTAATITMDGLMAHLRQQGQVGIDLLAENPSYIFFKSVSEAQNNEQGQVAAAGVPLVPMRSIAVDRHLHTFGLPFWIETTLPDTASEPRPFLQLVFAHDTGSAIKGAARADLFVGSGAEAGTLAGKLQQAATFTRLMPLPQDKGGV